MNGRFGIVLVVLLLSGCGAPTTGSPQQTSSQVADSWAFRFVNWQHHIYKMTADKVDVVGQQLGAVTNFSDVESTPQTGTFSNAYLVGTRLFEILGTDPGVAIAVEMSPGVYVRAVDTGAYGAR